MSHQSGEKGGVNGDAPNPKDIAEVTSSSFICSSQNPNQGSPNDVIYATLPAARGAKFLKNMNFFVRKSEILMPSAARTSSDKNEIKGERHTDTRPIKISGFFAHLTGTAIVFAPLHLCQSYMELCQEQMKMLP